MALVSTVKVLYVSVISGSLLNKKRRISVPCSVILARYEMRRVVILATNIRFIELSNASGNRLLYPQIILQSPKYNNQRLPDSQKEHPRPGLNYSTIMH